MKTQKTWLPIFSGFYNSIFDPSDSYIESETDLTKEEYQEYYENLCMAGVSQEFFNENFYDCLDYASGYKGASEYICNALIDLEHANIIQEIRYEKLVSPKFYNFSTDSIDCEITYDDEKMMQYLRDNKEAFDKYLTETYTSRDGFSSSYSNDIDIWMNEENHGEHEVGSILEFIIRNEEGEDAEMNLCCDSNCGEGFMNSVNFNENKMIGDFNKQKEEN